MLGRLQAADKDKDGKLSKQEYVQSLILWFADTDANLDSSITVTEWTNYWIGKCQAEKMKKAFYVLIVMVVLMSMLPSPAAAKKTGVMYISAMTGDYEWIVNKYSYSAFVTIKNTNGAPVTGAKVNATAIYFADGQIVTRELTSTTRDGGVAAFYVGTTSLTLTLTVTSVVKLGFTYDPEQNVISSITIRVLAP